MTAFNCTWLNINRYHRKPYLLCPAGVRTLMESVSVILSEELPTFTSYVPSRVFHASVSASQIDNGWLVADGSMVIVTCFFSPGSCQTFSKPTKRLGGWFAFSGRPK